MAGALEVLAPQSLPCNLQLQGALTDSPWWPWGGGRSLPGTAEGSFVRELKGWVCRR